MKPAHVLDEQSIRGLAFPYLTGQRRVFALAHPEYAVMDVRNFLSHFLSDVSAPISQAFNTTRRRRELRLALSSADRTTGAWLTHDRRDPRYQWVVPGRLASSLLDGNVTETLSRRMRASTAGRSIIRSYDHYAVWLPYLSLELVNLTHRLRTGDLARLQVLVAELAHDQGAHDEMRPWLPRFPLRLAALPTTWLYQYRPEHRNETLLTWLSTAGLTNVGHYVAFHPEALEALSRYSGLAWKELHTALLPPTAEAN